VTPAISGRDFAAGLERHGFDFVTGVPCSLIEDLIAVLERGSRAPYIAAVREDAAVGVAAGAWFGGRRPVVLMQNSGLGTSLNALASLSLMYGLPALLVVTWRGFGGKDAPEHILTGQISTKLLELLGVPYRVLGADSLDPDLAWAGTEMDARRCPVALLVPPRVVATGGVEPTAAPARSAAAPRLGAALVNDGPLPAATMPRLTALGIALKSVGDDPVAHANGYICRESFSLADRPQSFYMIGSMGLAPAIALGVALTRPTRPAIVFDGDGNLLMNLGILAMVAIQRPANFVHLVFDNEVYGSTGNQTSLSRGVRLDRLAAAAGFATAVAVTEPWALESALRAALATPGPHFVLVKVTPEEADVPRIPYTPAVLRDRFRAAVLAS
jgi:phosphonopyruvate decarboxylase